MTRLVQCSLVVAVACLCACPQPPNPPPPNEGEGEGPNEGEGEGDGPGEGEGEGEDPPPEELDPDASLLAADPPTPVPADGIAAFMITATLKSGNGAPMPDLPMAFTVDGAGATVTVVDTVSLADGTARATVSSTNVGSVTVSAIADGIALTTPIVVEFEGCRTPAQAFEQELYPKVFSRCQGCHNELGLARERGLEYVLPFPGVDDWAQRSVDVIASMATQIELLPDGTTELSRIVAKPMLLLEEGHEGGEVIKPDTEEERLLKGFANLLNAPDACAGVEPRADEALSRVTLLSPRETFARAKLALTGAVATPEELAAMPDTEEALDAELDALMATAEFEARIVEMYADWFLTDRFTRQFGQRRVLNRNNQFTRRFFYATEGTGNQQCDPTTDACCSEFFDATYCAGKEDALIGTLAREPLEIIKRMVREDRPISEAITLDHTFVTPLSATFYGFTDAQRAALFDANLANDATETAAAQLAKTPLNTLGGGPAIAPYPHAGLLTTHAVLARWSTTTSNKNRGRAQSLIMRRLMNVDVMKFAEFSTAELDPGASLDLATQSEIACTVCHSAVDRLAGLFQHFNGNGQYRVNPAQPLLENMPEFGFLGTPLPDADDPIRFAATSVVQHERFPLAMLVPLLTGLTGFSELDSALDPLDPDVEEKALALEIQREVMADLRARFVAHGLRVRPLIKDIIQHEVFRAQGIQGGGGTLTELERGALERAGIGRGAMITPEQLDRKLQSIFGFAWRQNRSPTGTNLLDSINQYRILFGGLNYESIATRFRDPSPVLARIVERMGNEMACLSVAQDFAITDASERRLFKNVTITDDDPALVRTELARLHKLLLEEEAATEELDASVAVFTDALAAGRALIAAGDSDDQLTSDCDATQSFEATPVPYPTTGRVVVRDDPDYVVRAWMVTISYLLSDPRFFTE